MGIETLMSLKLLVTPHYHLQFKSISFLLGSWMQILWKESSHCGYLMDNKDHVTVPYRAVQCDKPTDCPLRSTSKCREIERE